MVLNELRCPTLPYACRMTMGGREAAGDKIQWDRLEQSWFDRIVETLLLRKFHNEAAVVLLDGRGGDGGVDASVTFPDGRCIIYQLKYYPEGMSGGHRGRRNEVKKSYIRAVDLHEPGEWHLVTPRNYSDAELKFLRNLEAATPPGKRTPEIKWTGRGELDQMLIDFPEVDRWLTIDHYRQTRAIFEWERSQFLDNPSSDLANRVAALGDLADSVDPDWTWDFERRDGVTTQILRAQHGNAAMRSPISFKFTAASTPDFPAEKLRKSIEFGSPEEVEVPGSAIKTFEVSGSRLVDNLPAPDLLVLTSLPAESVPALGMLAELRFTEGGEVVATEEGVVKSVYRGTRGITSLMAFCNERLTLKVIFAHENPYGPSNLEITYKIDGLSPRAVANLLDTVSRFPSSDEIGIYLDGSRLARYEQLKFRTHTENPDWSEPQALLQFANDLEWILSHTQQKIPFPRRFTTSDRIQARVARLLVEGYIVASPLISAVTAYLSEDAELTPELRSSLTGRKNAQWPVGPYVARIAGRSFDLGLAMAVHPESWVTQGADVIEYLEGAGTKPDQLVIRPGDDPYFFAYLPNVDPRSYADRSLVRWGIDGVGEPWLNRPWIDFNDTTG